MHWASHNITKYQYVIESHEKRITLYTYMNWEEKEVYSIIGGKQISVYVLEFERSSQCQWTHFHNIFPTITVVKFTVERPFPPPQLPLFHLHYFLFSLFVIKSVKTRFARFSFSTLFAYTYENLFSILLMSVWVCVICLFNTNEIIAFIQMLQIIGNIFSFSRYF